MSRPRQVLPNQYYMLTRTCTQQQFLLRPDEETNNAFIYCLVEAAQRYDIMILLPMAESNHHHTTLYDRFGNIPAFAEHFHKMLARCMNARWGRWENFWSSHEVCITRLLGFEAVMDKLVYCAINPVKDLLVDSVADWPGANGYLHLIQNKPLRARRPKFFFKPGGKMPEFVEQALEFPAELGDHEQIIAELRRRVTVLEEQIRETRQRTGKRILGRRAVREQSWRSSAKSVRVHRGLRPRFAGPTEERIAALLAYKEFLAMYDSARRQWLAGRSATFPTGTYWLARFAPVIVAVTSN